jgi:hypothetical protein
MYKLALVFRNLELITSLLLIQNTLYFTQYSLLKQQVRDNHLNNLFLSFNSYMLAVMYVVTTAPFQNIFSL